MGFGHIIWTLIVGLVVGALARLMVPGQEHLGPDRPTETTPMDRHAAL